MIPKISKEKNGNQQMIGKIYDGETFLYICKKPKYRGILNRKNDWNLEPLSQQGLHMES